MAFMMHQDVLSSVFSSSLTVCLLWENPTRNSRAPCPSPSSSSSWISFHASLARIRTHDLSQDGHDSQRFLFWRFFSNWRFSNGVFGSPNFKFFFLNH
jgi:hypothetical protein